MTSEECGSTKAIAGGFPRFVLLLAPAAAIMIIVVTTAIIRAETVAPAETRGEAMPRRSS